jgi:NTP pyrophosphatase (non-canonical NTP hydrolase)
MTLDNLQKTVDKWITTIGVKYFGELTNMTVLTEEVGELARLMARVHGEQSFKRKEDEAQADANIQEELGDILFVVTCLANQMGYNLTDIMAQNLDKKTIRDKDRHVNNPKLQ